MSVGLWVEALAREAIVGREGMDKGSERRFRGLGAYGAFCYVSGEGMEGCFVRLQG